MFVAYFETELGQIRELLEVKDNCSFVPLICETQHSETYP